MPYWRLFYHIVWTTKNREPLILSDIETELYGHIAGKVTALGGLVYAVNGTVDHIHVVASVPPKIALGDFIGQLKGASAYHINHLPRPVDPPLVWQRSYGVISFSGKSLNWVVEYVRRQKEHHSEGTTVQVLEWAVDEDKLAPNEDC